MKRRAAGAALACAVALAFATGAAVAAPIPVVVDLDIGDDIDDSFALALLLASPEIELRGIGTVWGDTALRVRLVERLLAEAGRSGIPVRAGTPTASRTVFTQARWASGPHRPGEGVGDPVPAALAPVDASADAAAQILDLARRRPGEVTLLALGPLTNVAAALRRDPSAFRQLRQVVLMGGSVRAGYDQRPYRPPGPPDREYNIVADVAAAAALFASGVPIVMMPLDATVPVKLDEVRRGALFAHGSTLTDALALMTLEWTHGGQPFAGPTPTLFDVVPVAWLLAPGLCPTTDLRIAVDADGLTREVAGVPNARVCLASDVGGVLDRLMRALLR